MIDDSDILILRYLRAANRPIFGGHLSRNEPLTDTRLLRMIENGWVTADGEGIGYSITDAGREALKQAGK
jgi:hypothetical protein